MRGRNPPRHSPRPIACAAGHVAAELAADRRLAGKCLKCLRAGDRFVVVRDADLADVRKLGHVWPVPGD